VPLERLEAEICELAGHLAAATCRFLVLLGDFDARRGWASWEMSSCAAWLSWKCQMSSHTAREHVRVARALRDLPVIRAAFGAGRVSYAKVRALTRIATPDTETALAELAGPMTGNQLERFARAHRQVTAADDTAARIQSRVTFRVEDDGGLSGSFRLPPLQGAVLLKALRAAAGDLEHPHDGSDNPEGPGSAGRGGCGETAADAPPEVPAAAQPVAPTSSSLAGALVTLAEAFLAAKVAVAADPRSTRSSCTSAPTPSPQKARPPAPLASPRRRPHPRRRERCHRHRSRPRRGLPAIRRTRAAATSRTARPSAPTRRRCSRAGRPGPGCCTTAPASCSISGAAGGGRTRRCAGRPGSGTSAGAGSRAASPVGWTCTTSGTGPMAVGPC